MLIYNYIDLIFINIILNINKLILLSSSVTPIGGRYILIYYILARTSFLSEQT